LIKEPPAGGLESEVAAIYAVEGAGVDRFGGKRTVKRVPRPDSLEQRIAPA
jgi:hypothetical protein